LTLIKNEKLLIVAQAGRMLAQAARRIGLKPIVIDVFGDSDTESCALESWQIPQLSTDYLMPALADLITRPWFMESQSRCSNDTRCDGFDILRLMLQPLQQAVGHLIYLLA